MLKIKDCMKQALRKSQNFLLYLLTCLIKSLKGTNKKLQASFLSIWEAFVKEATKVAVGIKSNRNLFNIIASLFFIATLFSGVLWAIGNEIEPIAFTLSMLSSTFFGLPHFAEFIVPSRKAVKDMTYDELMDLVKASDSRKDWKGINTDWINEVYLIEDPRLRFRAKYTDEGVQCDDYKDTWANCYPDPNATGYWYDLFYDGNLIHRFILVAVDGARAQIPAPEFGTNKVNILHYQVARINDSQNTVDEYLRRSRLEIAQDDDASS